MTIKPEQLPLNKRLRAISPKVWAKKIRTKIPAKTLQAQVALLLAWDYSDRKFSEGLAEFLGEDLSVGRIIPQPHPPEEVWKAMLSIHYPHKEAHRTLARLRSTTKGKGTSARRGTPDRDVVRGVTPYRRNDVGITIDMVNRGHKQFFKRRGIIPAPVSKSMIDGHNSRHPANNERIT